MSKLCCYEKNRYKIYYFNCRNLGEAARLILHYANVHFEDIHLTHEQFDRENMKKKFPFGKLPVLEMCGKQLAESNAINRFLARKYGLAGKNDLESAFLDSIADFQKDVFSEIAPYLYVKLGYKEGNLPELKTKFIECANKNFPVYIKLLNESGSEFLSKSGLSWVDFVVAEFLFNVNINEPNVLKKFPELEAYIENVHGVPQIKDYVKNRPKYDI